MESQSLLGKSRNLPIIMLIDLFGTPNGIIETLYSKDLFRRYELRSKVRIFSSLRASPVNPAAILNTDL